MSTTGCKLRLTTARRSRDSRITERACRAVRLLFLASSTRLVKTGSFRFRHQACNAGCSRPSSAATF